MAYLKKRISPVKHYTPQVKVCTQHDLLCDLAERWLKRKGCKVTIRDPFKSLATEQPDAIGWRDGVSVLVECKASRSDFLADRKKPHRLAPETGMGDWRFFLCPAGMIDKGELPPGWGLLELEGKRVKEVFGVPGNARWHSMPFTGNKKNETILLASALRRFADAGMLDELYKKSCKRCEECGE